MVDNILYINTDDYLSTFFLKDNQKFNCTKPLSLIMNMLPDNFFQISRSCVVNLDEIESVKRGTRIIIMSNSSEHIVSMRRVSALNIALTE